MEILFGGPAATQARYGTGASAGEGRYICRTQGVHHATGHYLVGAVVLCDPGRGCRVDHHREFGGIADVMAPRRG
jgi:hypothetical protein